MSGSTGRGGVRQLPRLLRGVHRRRDRREGTVGGAGVLALKPGNLTFEQAAAFPLRRSTALQGPRDAGGLQAGESKDHRRVRRRRHVRGAAGQGVRSARHRRAQHRQGRARPVARDDVVEYTHEDFAERPEHDDLILDKAGNARSRNSGAHRPRADARDRRRRGRRAPDAALRASSARSRSHGLLVSGSSRHTGRSPRRPLFLKD